MSHLSSTNSEGIHSATLWWSCYRLWWWVWDDIAILKYSVGRRCFRCLEMLIIWRYHLGDCHYSLSLHFKYDSVISEAWFKCCSRYFTVTIPVPIFSSTRCWSFSETLGLWGRLGTSLPPIDTIHGVLSACLVALWCDWPALVLLHSQHFFQLHRCPTFRLRYALRLFSRSPSFSSSVIKLHFTLSGIQCCFTWSPLRCASISPCLCLFLSLPFIFPWQKAGNLE